MASVDGKVFQTGYSDLTPQDIASFLKRSFTDSEETLVEGFILDVEYELASLCNRNFNDSLTYYEVFNAGFNKAQLYNTPIYELKALFIDTVDKKSLYTLGTHYFIYDNSILFTTPIVGAGLPYNAIKIEYTIKKFWGQDVVKLITKWVAYEFLNSENAGVGLSNMSFDSLSQTFNISAYKKEKEALIFRYTKFQI